MTTITNPDGSQTFKGDVPPPLPENMVASTQQIIDMWPDAAKRADAQKALDARWSIGEIMGCLTAPIAKSFLKIEDDQASFYAGLIDLMKNPVLKAEAYESLQERDQFEVERLLKEDADKK